jgi:hypothetical protein
MIKGPNFEPGATARRFGNPKATGGKPISRIHVTNRPEGKGQGAARQITSGSFPAAAAAALRVQMLHSHGPRHGPQSVEANLPRQNPNTSPVHLSPAYRVRVVYGLTVYSTPNFSFSAAR